MKIVYTRPDNGVSVVSPTDPTWFYKMFPDQELTFLEYRILVGEKDVPPGIDFWIVEDSAIPQDRSTRNFWTLEDMGVPSGSGMTLQEFKEKYPYYKNPGGTWQ